MFYAKSNPPETVKKHTDELLDRFEKLYALNRGKYPYMNGRDWELLKIAVLYHDIGKTDPVFQNKIRLALKKPQIESVIKEYAQHNYLSVLTIPYKKLDLSEEESHLLALTVGYHHEKKILPDKELLKQVFKNHIIPIISDIEAHMEIEISSRFKGRAVDWLTKRIRSSEGDLFYRYVMIKGLLHRLDHAASAHVPIELAIHYHPDEFVNRFIEEKLNEEKRPLQLFAEENQNNHVIVIAQTGMGKTEAGLLWIGKEKGFLTLPLRVSINAMYERIKDTEKGIGFSSKIEKPHEEEQAIGLLHSTSLDYLYDINEAEGDGEENLQLVYEQSKQFSNKLIISTIDQILKFPFFYKGFEKELSLLAGAKVVIDEMQSYDPKIAALLIRALELIDNVGGKFMIMTATMPKIYINALQKKLMTSRFPIVQDKFFDDSVKRHQIKLHTSAILDFSEKMVEDGKGKKVLVICNTVRRAKEVYKRLIDCKTGIAINLLHSMFIRRDRAEKEKAILDFAKSKGTGIWVTTQLVEASLDIDFDVLYTEMSTLDSLFQRLGRCNRKGKKAVNESNVHIFLDDVSGIGSRAVYHPEIFKRSVTFLEKSDGTFLLESEKMEMIEKLYDEEELEGTEFKQTFNNALQELTDMPAYELDNKKAQELLRDIRQVQVIPHDIFIEEAQPLFDLYKETPDKMKRRKLKRDIDRLTVGVNEYLARSKGLLAKSGIPNTFKELYIMECEYSKEKGIEIEKAIDPYY